MNQALQAAVLAAVIAQPAFSAEGEPTAESVRQLLHKRMGTLMPGIEQLQQDTLEQLQATRAN